MSETTNTNLPLEFDDAMEISRRLRFACALAEVIFEGSNDNPALGDLLQSLLLETKILDFRRTSAWNQALREMEGQP